MASSIWQRRSFISSVLLLLAGLICRSDLIEAAELTELLPYHREITLTGFTSPKRELTLTSEASGRITEIFADTGEPVPESGKLAELDPTFILLDIEANAIAQEQTARQLRHEEKTLARYTALIKEKSTPQAQLDEVSLAADLHRLNLKKLKNEAVRLKEKLARHTIAAPRGWQVIERLAEAGEFIQSGKPVARLGDFRQLLVPFAVTYSELQAISNMEALSLFLPDVEKTVPATIYRESPVFDEATRKIHIDLIIQANNPDQQITIRGGMRANLRFRNTDKTTTYRIASSALISRYEASWLVRPDGTRIQVILIGHSDDGRFSIVSGKTLEAGQHYLLNPTLSQ